AAADVDGVAAGPIRADLLVRERALDDLVRAGRRDVAQEANVARPPLRAEGLLGMEPVSDAGRVERRAVAQDDADHHLIARLVVRHSVHGSDDHVGVTRDRVLDWLSGEVLAVDAYPFGVATREVEVAVPVEVPEVASPVPAESQRAFVGVGVVVVALEGTRPADVHDLADAFVRVDEATGGVEPREGTFVALLVDDLHVLTDEA